MNSIRWGVSCALVAALAGCVGYGYPIDTGYPSDGGYYGGGQGYPSGGGYYGGGQGYPRDRDPRYGGGYAGNGVVRCESTDRKTRRCSVDTAGGVRLSRQLSGTQCLQGRNWGYDRGSIWVSGGCRAEFIVGAGGGRPGGYGPGGGYGGGGQTLRCESNERKTKRCNVDTRGGVRLSRQLSGTPCVQGQTWGYDRNGIWVSGGCRAEFIVR